MRESDSWFESLRFGVAKILNAAGAELPWRGRLRFVGFSVADDPDHRATLVSMADAPDFVRSAIDHTTTTALPADEGEGWVELWSVERSSLAPADGTIRDLRFRLTVSSEDPAAADVATAVAVFQRADAGEDQYVNADDGVVSSPETPLVEWELALLVANETLALRLWGDGDNVILDAKVHATIDRDVVLRCYLGPADVCPYAVTPT